MDRILVMSDDPQVREEARLGFPADVEVLLAADAREAGRLLDEDAPPAAVIVDLRSGSAGGFALAREMRHQPRLAKVPIVMLIERGQDRWLAQQAGAAVVATKPIEVDELVRNTLSVAAR